MEYENCLVELDEVLNYLSKENLYKIPEEIREGIKSQKSKEYIWKYDETKKLKEQNLNRKTIAMLSYLNMEYLLNNEQKELMKEIHEINEQNQEKENQEKYNMNNLFNNTKNDTAQSEVALVEMKKHKWYSTIFNFIKNIFKGDKLKNIK